VVLSREGGIVTSLPALRILTGPLRTGEKLLHSECWSDRRAEVARRVAQLLSLENTGEKHAGKTRENTGKHGDRRAENTVKTRGEDTGTDGSDPVARSAQKVGLAPVCPSIPITKWGC